MRCGNCLHARVDHSSGRCINRTDRLHRETGVSVVTVCRCKSYRDEAATPAQVAAVAAVEPVSETEAEEQSPADTEKLAPSAEKPTRRRFGR